MHPTRALQFCALPMALTLLLGPPPTPTRGNIEVIDSGLDVRRDVVPIKLRIFIDDVRRRLVAELPVQTNLFKFVVKRIGFSQVVRIAKLTDEICGAQE